MKRALALLSASTLLAATFAPAQLGSMDATAKAKSYVLYAAEQQTVPAGKRGVLELRFHMVSGYHVNSHTPKSQLLIPTALTLQPASGVTASAPEYPSGTPFSFSFDPTDKLDVYAGDFTIKLPVVATAGAHTVAGSLKYQACDHASCYPPRTLPVQVVFTAK
jgi:DsbC/DsbD-like thiol-disulfide interchange protein